MAKTWPATIDYSYGRPSMKSILDAGYKGVLRYLGGDGRCIFAAERDQLLAANLGIGLIWETTAARPLDGYQAGRDDVHRANDYANRLGAPHDTRIYYAVDFQPTTSQLHGPVTEYFRGVMDAGGREPRAYGCASVMQRLCGDMGYFADSWQCAAWSYPGTAPGKPITDGGYNLVLSPYASFLQNIGYVLGDTSDHNSLINSNLSWMWGIEGDDDVMTDDDFNRITAIVGMVLDNRIDQFLTPRQLWKDGDVCYEVLVAHDGERVRRKLKTNEIFLLRKGSELSEQPFVDVASLETKYRDAFRAWRQV